jgi:hypothetical protein
VISSAAKALVEIEKTSNMKENRQQQEQKVRELAGG